MNIMIRINMKPVSKSVSLWLFVLIVLIFLSCDKSQADINQENLKKIKKGMSMGEVETIMGKPDSVLLFGNKNYWFMYNAPIGMSDNFYIFISKKDSTVIGVVDGT